MDLDGDGYLSPYELEWFWEAQQEECEVSIEFPVIYLQLHEMIKPAQANKISLRDLKRSKLGAQFFDILFDKEKLLQQEYEAQIYDKMRETP